MVFLKVTSNNVNYTSREYIDALIAAKRKEQQNIWDEEEEKAIQETKTNNNNNNNNNNKPEKANTNNIKEEKVSKYIAPFIIKNKNGDEYVHRGLLAEYLIENVPAIYATGQLYIYEDGVYRPAKENEEKGIIKKLITPQFSNMALINDVAQQWIIDERVNKFPHQLNPDPYKLNLLNGILNLKTMELEEHTPNYYSTIQIKANYNKNAKGEHFKKFLDSSVPDKKIQMLLQEIVGYSLTTLTDSKKMIFILDGPSDTGKSTFITATLENLLTDNAKSHVELQELSDNEYKQAELFEKVVNIYADLPAKGIQDIGYIKAATGGDKITARRIYGHPFSFYNKAKFVFSTNGLPANYSKDTSDAFYNRLIIIPFNQVPKQKDVTLKEKLANEKDFIFMWALEGLLRLIKNGFKFTETETTEQLLQEYKQENNPVMRFVNECCELGDYTIPRATLYTHYENFCEQNNYKKLSAIKFNKELEKAYPQITRKQLNDARRTKAWYGIRCLDFTEF
ncbi:putative DNA primase/helicase [Aneurinibacillus thermoaerophilus]|uniref:Putative DNA primase/helicase n=1 Tax=Aneurinibacillus thermoaerophilus TaxID=143495 RepID=A0A1G7WP09_ANETH|nr:phage/plasmid primase, P4 family [Aneurinibacillus thermoaerophilus]SDG73659.1 putative DNA primase/helicase [Aneurinibacillus thermoaerophilus]